MTDLNIKGEISMSLPKLPRKFSYRRKPVTLSIPFTSCNINSKFYRLAIAEVVPMTGVVPFDWKCFAVVPNWLSEFVADPCSCCGGPKRLAVLYFGYDTLKEAKAVQERFKRVNRSTAISNDDKERVILRQVLEVAESLGERPTLALSDGTEVPWRDHPMFRLPKLPRKFSYPHKPVTLSIPFTNCKINSKFYRQAIAEVVPMTGVVPFDWEHFPVAPEWLSECVADPCPCCGGPKRLAVLFFGYDTLEEAKAVEERLTLVNHITAIWTDDEEPAMLRPTFEQAEVRGERPTITLDDGTEVPWRDHPMFRVN
jgi:hypothetical protein